MWATITLSDGQVLEDVPGNQLQDVYEQQGEKPWLAWVGLLELFDWKLYQPNYSLDITVAAVFRQKYAVRVAQSQLCSAWCNAVAWLQKVANINLWSVGLADWAISTDDPVAYYTLSLHMTLGMHETILPGCLELPVDDQLCTWYGQDYNLPSIILSNWCNH